MRKWRLGYVVGYEQHQGYSFPAVLVINGTLILAILALNRARLMHYSPELGNIFRRSYFFIIWVIGKSIIKIESKALSQCHKQRSELGNYFNYKSGLKQGIDEKVEAETEEICQSQSVEQLQYLCLSVNIQNQRRKVSTIKSRSKSNSTDSFSSSWFREFRHFWLCKSR